MKKLFCLILVLSLSFELFSQTEVKSVSSGDMSSPLTMGNLKMKDGKFIDAIVESNKVIALDSNNVKAYIARGDAKKHLHKYKEAIKDYNKCLLLDDKNILGYTGRGELNFDLKKYEASVSDFSMAITLGAEHGTVYRRMACSMGLMKDRNGSVKALNKAKELDPKFAMSFYNLGFYYLNLRNYEYAITVFNKAINLDTITEQTFVKKEILVAKNNAPTETINDNELLLREKAKEFALKAALKLKGKDFVGAIADLTNAITINSKEAEFYYNRAVIKTYLYNFKGALEDYDKAIALDSEYATVLSNRRKENPDSNKKDYIEALQDYEKTIDIEPKNEDAYASWGNVLLLLYNEQEAIIKFSNVIELNPKNIQAYDNRGVAKLNIGDQKGACRDFVKAQNLSHLKNDYVITNKCRF